MTTLTKAELVNLLIKNLNFDKSAAKRMVDSFFLGIDQQLRQGQMVRLSSFGNFVLRDKNARQGRNPKTGEAVEVSARRVVTFRAGAKLKKIIQNQSS